MKLQLKIANLLGIEAVCVFQKTFEKLREITVFSNLISIFAWESHEQTVGTCEWYDEWLAALSESFKLNNSECLRLI